MYTTCKKSAYGYADSTGSSVRCKMVEADEQGIHNYPAGLFQHFTVDCLQEIRPLRVDYPA